jgi:hypothetical protein
MSSYMMKQDATNKEHSMNWYRSENFISQKQDDFNLEFDTNECIAWNKRIYYYHYLSLNTLTELSPS